MLKKSRRLSTGEFNEVMNKGKIKHSPDFLVRMLLGQTTTKVSVVAPQKVAKTAVLRNRIRRRMYAVLRPHFSRIIPGVHAVIFAKSGAVDADAVAFAHGLERLLSDSKLLRQAE